MEEPEKCVNMEAEAVPIETAQAEVPMEPVEDDQKPLPVKPARKKRKKSRKIPKGKYFGIRRSQKELF